MNKIEKMLQELCPDGVEWKKLGELGVFYGGLSGKTKDDFKDGNAKFITYMNVYQNPSLNLNITDTVKVCAGEKQNIVEYCDVLFTGSSETPDECGMSSVVNTHLTEPFYLNSFSFGFRLNNPKLFNPNFLKHLFRSDELRKAIKGTASGVTRFNVSKKRFANIEIPIPPLAVQNEIVRVLDNFTELTAELTAELSARKEQYEYYRNRLLNFSDENSRWGQIKWMKMSEICSKICSGKNKIKFSEGEFPVFGSTGIIGYCSNYKYDKAHILVARVGANAGYTHIAEGLYDVSDNTIIVDVKNGYIYKYIYYQLINMNLNQYAKGGGQPLITAGELKKLEIPIPPLAEQERIVGILDRFEALTNDLQSGLPAEIEARQLQYEYYRNKLLTFDRKPRG